MGQWKQWQKTNRRIFSSKRCRKIERGSYVLKSRRGREERGSEVVAGVKETDGDVYKRTRRDGCGQRQEHKMIRAGTSARWKAAPQVAWHGMAGLVEVMRLCIYPGLTYDRPSATFRSRYDRVSSELHERESEKQSEKQSETESHRVIPSWLQKANGEKGG